MDSPSRSTHPMVIVAATMVTIASLTAIAWFAGLIPSKQETPATPAPQAAVVPTTTPAPSMPTPPPAEKIPVPTAKTAAAPPQDTPIPPPRPVRQTPPREPTYAQRSFSAETPINDGGYVERQRSQPSYPQQAQNYQYPNACRDCGTVESVREIKHEGEGSGLGAVGGGVVGGILGNQVGGGRGKAVGAVVGALGGAYAGNEAEKHIRATTRYDITVRFDDGNTRVFSESQPPPVQRGDRVRITNGQLVRM